MQNRSILLYAIRCDERYVAGSMRAGVCRGGSWVIMSRAT